MILFQKIFKSDLIGALASSLCLIHCIATPFLFVAKACSATCCSSSPVWWQAIDYVFIIISFFAIFFATKNSTKKWIVFALWSSWFLLLITILCETFETGLFPSSFIYFPSAAIIGFHFYNLKYCKCREDTCYAII